MQTHPKILLYDPKPDLHEVLKDAVYAGVYPPPHNHPQPDLHEVLEDAVYAGVDLPHVPAGRLAPDTLQTNISKVNLEWCQG